ncbi:cobalamin-dependent protein [Anaerolineales bacterium HSG24]|nr:cobalamin-dependent protein [Anaerolineales bacterium HSG24]
MTKALVSEFKQALLMLDRLAAKRISAEGRQRLSPPEFVEKVVIPALEEVGEGWEDGSVALSQVYMSGRICEGIVDALLPPGDPDRKEKPKMAVAVFEDHHMLGKRIVYSMLRASGFELLDYGRVETEGLIQRVKADGVRVLLLSTLMFPSALRIKEVRDRLNGDVKIVVGGAPFRFDDQLWQEIGADAMGKTASEAVNIITQITGEKS